MREDAQDVPTMDETTNEQVSEDRNSASDKDGNECDAAESDDDIVDEKIQQSPMKNRTRSKSRKVAVPDTLLFSYSENELPHQ